MNVDAALLARVEEAGLNASAPPQQRLIDGWLARFSPGKAKRARCVNAVASGRLPLDGKLGRCGALYRDAGLPLIVRVTPFSQPPDLDRALADRGWRRFDDTCVMVRTQLADRPVPAADADAQPVAIEPFAQHVGALRGSPLAQRQAHAQRLASAPVPFSAMVLRHEGQIVACGQLAFEDDLVGLYDVVTASERRREGLARRLCEQLLSLAVKRGAGTAYLQVDSDNVAARALYRQLGFVDGYLYHYRSADAAA
jgi:ribosomal protein S18 acetylase RimI-like enzyme